MTPGKTTATSDARGGTEVRLPWETVDEQPAPVAPTGADAGVSEGEAEAPAEAGAEARSETETEAVDYESPVPAEPLVDDLGPAPRGGGWTVSLLCVGIGLIACCVLIPQADANRRLAYEREKLKLDLESIRKQVSTNDEFLKRVADDPNLAERLAQRQMKIIREGTRVLELKQHKQARADRATRDGGPLGGVAADDMSPFHLVHVAPPPPLPPYKPVGGLLAGLCYNPHTRLYLTGIGLFLMAAGLVLGVGSKP